ncbi:MAG: cobalamin biosynthesis protein CobD [SAR202 cluster bacterium Io17-Chloro-G9]|nr:MAG: cobalamin biosynthesis protein CobD [SAR202 cluster bacterium Io17-Chloro-G9]
MWGFSDDFYLLALAVLLDLVVGEPPARIHPTVWIGRTVSRADRLSPREGWRGLLAGALMVLVITALWGGAAYFAALGLREAHSLAYILVGAALLKTTFAVKMLHQAAAKVGRLLAQDNLAQVRANMSSLVSRDTTQLTPEQAASATVESVSENMSDSFIGPWLAFALFGLPGAVAYRAVNTLDSMIGYHGVYEYLGKAAARLDDLLNLAPARLSGALLVAASFVLPGLSGAGAWRIMKRDRSRTQSPNAGWTMSGMAGALGVQLEKVSLQGGYRLGDPARTLEPRDITKSIQSMYLVAALGLALALGLTYLRDGLF